MRRKTQNNERQAPRRSGARCGRRGLRRHRHLAPLHDEEVFFNKAHAIALYRGKRPGLLSLIFWVLTIVVSIKYALVILRADNQGEGGTMVLLAMALRGEQRQTTALAHAAGHLWRVAVLWRLDRDASGVGAQRHGRFDEINEDWLVAVVPVTVVILIGLFYVQRTGTGKSERVVRTDRGRSGSWCLVAWAFITSPATRPCSALNPWYAGISARTTPACSSWCWVPPCWR